LPLNERVVLHYEEWKKADSASPTRNPDLSDFARGRLRVIAGGRE
jgi:hypothetical protein